MADVHTIVIEQEPEPEEAQAVDISDAIEANAEAEAEATIIRAEADAEATIINAEANLIAQETLSEQYNDDGEDDAEWETVMSRLSEINSMLDRLEARLAPAPEAEEVPEEPTGDTLTVTEAPLEADTPNSSQPARRPSPREMRLARRTR